MLESFVIKKSGLGGIQNFINMANSKFLIRSLV